MAKRRKRTDYKAPETSSTRALAPQTAPAPMPKQTGRSWWPIAGAALLFTIGVGSAVGAAIARGGDPPIPVPGVSVTQTPMP